MIKPTEEEIAARRAANEPIIIQAKGLVALAETVRDGIHSGKNTCECCGRENHDDWNLWLARQHMNAAINSVKKAIEKLERPPQDQWEDRREDKHAD